MPEKKTNRKEIARLIPYVEAVLDKFDQGITLQKELMPPVFHSTNKRTSTLLPQMVTPKNHMFWGLVVGWPVSELRTPKTPSRMRHDAMWLKFNQDFPRVWLPYEIIVKRGLRRTMPEHAIREDGSEWIEAIYFTTVPHSALNPRDRRQHVRDAA